MAVIYRKITEIKPNPKNPRVIKDEKFAKLVQSIKDFPEMLEKILYHESISCWLP